MLPSDQNRKVGQNKLSCPPLGKILKYKEKRLKIQLKNKEKQLKI